MHQIVPTIYYFFWVRYHPSRIYSQKKSSQETKYRPHFSPTTKPRPLNPLNHGPTSLLLAGYMLVVLQPLCACSIVFCVCLPRHFCHSRLVLFCSAACLFCLISSHVSCYVCHFPLVWLFFPSVWLFFPSHDSFDTPFCNLHLTSHGGYDTPFCNLHLTSHGE